MILKLVTINNANRELMWIGASAGCIGFIFHLPTPPPLKNDKYRNCWFPDPS